MAYGDEVVQKRIVAGEEATTYRHIFPPATAEQISRGVGVTPEEAAYVDRVLKKLGYLPRDKEALRKAASKPKKSAKG